MAFSQILVPYSVNTDIASSLVQADVARFIKNITYSLDDSSVAGEGRGASTGVFKPLQSTEEYLTNLVLPLGVNFPIGSLAVNETKEVYCFIYNSLSNHTIYRIKGDSQTYDIVYQGPELNFQLKPEYFIHKGGAYLEIIYVSDPITGEKLRRSFLQFTDGFNPQRFICVEDSVATQSFNPGLFPYFSGVYDRAYLISMGVPTPSDCINIEESTAGSDGQNNKLLFNTWQFRFLDTDVWGRPSEHGMISNMYAAGDGGCIGQSSTAARCLKLIAPAPAPHINSRQIEYRNCNSTQWYRTETINLYDGSQFGEWWLRPRNPKVDYNAQTHEITYEFCADKECDPIDPNETLRTENPIPTTSNGVAKVGKFTALYGNKYGFIPFSEELKNKLSVTVIPPDPSAVQDNSVNIDVWLEIFNWDLKSNQPIWYDGGQFKNYVWGAFYTPIQYRSTFAYKQFFLNGDQKGFVGYLAGTDVFTISKQYFLSNTGTLTEITDFTQTNIKQYYTPLPSPFPGNNSGNYGNKPNGTFLQKFEFRNIPKGKYIFRLANHQIDPNTDKNYQKTSTYLYGSFPFNSGISNNPINHTLNTLNKNKELIIDACQGDYDGFNQNRILTILDMNAIDADIEQGYVKNTDVEGESQYGVELLKYDGIHGEITSFFTDHNGFFFSATQSEKGYNRNNEIYGYCNCNLIQIFPTFQTGNNENAHTIVYKYLNSTSLCQNYENQPCNYILIKGKVCLCDSEIGIPGVSVVLSRGQVVKTDDNGDFTLIAHDDVLNPNRVDDLYFMTGSCPIKTCEGECLAPIQVTINKCISGCQDREISVITTYGKYNTTRGLLSGGTYPIGITQYDWIDRHSYIQPLGTITIPTITESKAMAPSTLVLNIPPDAVFPETAKYITVSIGEETTIEDYVTWIVDSFQFIDNTGKENVIAPTQIKIYYASLIEYNKQNDYNTTVNWGFISQTTNVPVTADKVQFWLNGDGTFFPKNITALVKYNVDGQYFLINYTEDLKDLKANAIIRLERPKECTGTESYYELCLKIPIINRHAVVESVVLNAFDTYYINRQIPVPTLVPDTDPPEFINEPRIYGTPFEHNSPSDFWGKKCKNLGRPNVKNPYETVLYKEDQVALSGALSPNGQLNYLNYFEDTDAKKIDFSDAKGNGIVALFPQTGSVLFICQNNWFVAGFNDNLLRTKSDGSVQANTINNSFGRPEVKIGNNFGCNLFDKNTIDYYQGLVHWLDTNRLCVVQNNYDICLPISKNGIDGYIRSKINAVKEFNSQNDNRRFFFGSTNPLASEYLLSDKIIGDEYNFNDERDYNVDVPETNRFGIGTKDFRGQYCFCPEMFSFLQSDRNDIQLFSFIGSKPQYHYSTLINKGIGMIYGKRANRIIRVVVSLDSLRKKKGLAIAVVCTESLYFVDQVLTENQKSRILKSQWKKADFGWYAPILCNQDSGGANKNKLMDGEMLQGNYLDIRFVGDPASDTIDSKLQGFLVNIFGQSNNFTTGK